MMSLLRIHILRQITSSGDQFRILSLDYVEQNLKLSNLRIDSVEYLIGTCNFMLEYVDPYSLKVTKYPCHLDIDSYEVTCTKSS